MIYKLLGWNFDEAINLDDSFNFDDADSRAISITSSVELYPASMHYYANEVRDITIKSIIDDVTSPVSYVDLIRLIPEKFRSSQMMIDYMDAVSMEVGSWIASIDEIVNLLNPYTVGKSYIGKLGALLGLKLRVTDDANISDLRRQVVDAVAWIKSKGTYQSLELIGYLTGYDIEIKDLYTNDYANFVEQDWFIADYEEENPPGLDSSYYKSPHFGFNILLNTLYDEGSGQYLWRDSMFTNINEDIDLVRPINTVPHIGAVLNASTYDDGEVYTTAVDVMTAITSDWTYERIFFDDGTWVFDDGTFLDRSDSLTNFVNSITKFKIGTGNKGTPPEGSSFVLDSVVYTGTIDSKTIYDDRIEFIVILDTALTYSALSEIGLFFNDETTMLLASTFPDVDKTEGMELKFLITVYI